jgi:C-terminal processing protease CtpA/Prc
VQEVTHLERGGELKMTVAYYYLPSGRLVHQKKGATDWGVNPNIVVPMDEDAQKWLAQNMEQSDLFRRPVVVNKSVTQPASKPASQPATTQAGTKPTTQYTDTQLEAAVTTMIGQIVLKDQRDVATHAQAAPVTKPAQ